MVVLHTREAGTVLRVSAVLLPDGVPDDRQVGRVPAGELRAQLQADAVPLGGRCFIILLIPISFRRAVRVLRVLLLLHREPGFERLQEVPGAGPGALLRCVDGYAGLPHLDRTRVGFVRYPALFASQRQAEIHLRPHEHAHVG